MIKYDLQSTYVQYSTVLCHTVISVNKEMQNKQQFGLFFEVSRGTRVSLIGTNVCADAGHALSNQTPATAVAATCIYCYPDE